MTSLMEDPPANDNYSRKFARLTRNEAFFLQPTNVQVVLTSPAVVYEGPDQSRG